ncbi:rRNA maturation RNase YbeY [Brevundimonas sp.]|uniref:rRNA maturation RNase YbeY n=1 Tax=Brevundimonas sp. TaxID=1871086 RepID=UPI00289CDBF1|nr:rRNA maturation RNase YbeY [Brevundimonas sp.]
MIEIEIEADGWNAALADAEAVVDVVATKALGSVEGDVVVLLADDEAVQDLNKRFRDKDRPTNVLSFPAAESAFPHLGDVVLGLEYCVEEAKAQGKTLKDHLSHLVVHGVLHLLGRDHVEDEEAEQMEAEEREILASLGIADPYAGERD